MWNEYISASSIEDVLNILTVQQGRVRIVAGATDLMLELERGLRPGIKTLIDISRIPDLDNITLDENEIIHIGPLVTHNHCAGSTILREYAYPLARAAWEVGAPQIRNRGTVAGNLITASPANDTITPLMALGAWLTLKSSNGQRKLPLSKFFTGVRSTVIRSNEMLVDISFPAMKDDQCGAFMKLALRRTQAISVVNLALLLTFNASKNSESDQLRVKSAVITIGAVAPTIIHAAESESYLAGKVLTSDVITQAADMAAKSARPIDDIRGTAAFRREMVRVLTQRGLRDIANGQAQAAPGRYEQSGFPTDPVLLWGKASPIHSSPLPRSTSHVTHSMSGQPIRTTINGKAYTFPTGQNKSLLRLLREEAGLTGTKEGCAEGECGACTIFLDGKAVMACLVPAPRAHGAEIVTVEGLVDFTSQPFAKNRDEVPKVEGTLHPVQESFIKNGAVQCGYCTPGFLMSAAKLLEEKAHPTRGEIAQALTGNLCRCTGYYKIVKAIEDASVGAG